MMDVQGSTLALRVTISAIAVLGLALVAAVPAARAAPVRTAVVLDSPKAEYTAREGGGWTASVGLTNRGQRPARIVARAVGARARTPTCALGLDGSSTLPAARHATFKIAVPPACGLAKKRFGFRIRATSGGKTDVLKVSATFKAKAEAQKPDWDTLWRGFGGALVIAGLLMYAAYAGWPAKGAKSVTEELPYLPDSWNFGDSWASNVTVVGGVLTGVLGSSGVLKAVLGDDAEGALAIATVGGAVAAALVAAAGIVVLAANGRSGAFTVGGLLAASAIALGAAGGELFVVWEGARHFDLGGVEDYLVVFLGLAALLLVVYGYRSVSGVLVDGSTAPEPMDWSKAPLTETVFAASLIAQAIHDAEPASEGQATELLATFSGEPRILGALAEREDTSPAALTPPRRRRSALP